MASSEEQTAIMVAEKVARELVEQVSADAVVIVWTSQRRKTTRIFRHQVGNRMLCDALVNQIATEQNAPEEK